MDYAELQRFVTSFESVRQLVLTTCEQEGSCLDYKSQPYGGGDSQKIELRRDATAFVNHRGGIIIVGATEDGTGNPTGLSPIQDAGAVADRMRDILSSSIEPRITGIRVEPYFENRTAPAGCVVVFVPPYQGRKHLVVLPDGRFEGWVRQDRSKRGMSYTELSAVFVERNEAWDIVQRLQELKSDGGSFAIEPILDASRQGDEWILERIEALTDAQFEKITSTQHLVLPIGDLELVRGLAKVHKLSLKRGALDWNPVTQLWEYRPRLTEDRRRQHELALELGRAMQGEIPAEVVPSKDWRAEETPLTVDSLDRSEVRLRGRNCASDFPIPLSLIRAVDLRGDGRIVTIRIDGELRYDPAAHIGRVMPR